MLTIVAHLCSLSVNCACTFDSVAHNYNKKAELSQRRPRDAPNIWL